MKKLYACPNCAKEHSRTATRYEDGGGEFGDELTPVFDCYQCGQWFTGDEGFIGYTGQPDDNPNNPIPFWRSKCEQNPPQK